MTIRILLHQKVVEPGDSTLKEGAVTTELTATPKRRAHFLLDNQFRFQ